MTYPLELRERTPRWDAGYPVAFHHNRSRGSRKNDAILSLHWHESLEIIEMRSGRAVFHIDSVPYEASPGDVLFVPSGGLHVGYNAEDADVYYVAIVFHPSLLRSAQPDAAYDRHLAPFLDGRAQPPAKLSAADPETAAIRGVVRGAIEEDEKRDEAYTLAVQALFQQLYVLLSRRFLPQRLASSPSPSPYAETFKPLFRFVETNVDKPMPLAEAARMVNLNLFYFCKTFKKLTGRTYVDYVNACRADEAERLLRHTELSITGIADKVGCGNVNYFTKLYKKYKGKPPSHARK